MHSIKDEEKIKSKQFIYIKEIISTAKKQSIFLYSFSKKVSYKT